MAKEINRPEWTNEPSQKTWTRLPLHLAEGQKVDSFLTALFFLMANPRREEHNFEDRVPHARAQMWKVTSAAVSHFV